ncbi:hypothetical protein ID866_11893, partial [Astraeus odoratus]
MSSVTGHCKQSNPNKAPVLMAGDVTPEALHAWEMGCHHFFRQKVIADADQVARVAWNLQDPHIQDWYTNASDHLNQLTFPKFMSEVHLYWLPPDWAATVCQKMLLSTQGSKPCHLWAVEIQSLNILLHGSDSHLSEANLHYHLESHMHLDLCANYHSSSIADKKDFHKWIEKVCLLDEKCCRDLAKQKEAVEAALGASGHQPLQPSHAANARTKPPTASSDEWKFLQANSGCFKCCCFFQTHTTLTCPNDFPDPKGYKTLTAEDVELAHNKKHAPPVVAVVSEEPAAKRLCSEEPEMEPITVIMPLAALGDGSDSGDECIAPFFVPHLHWTCLLDGPNVEESIPVNALIDHSSHLVLIDVALVKKLGLHKHALPQPLEVAVALSSDDQAAGHEVVSLQEYVVLSCLSSDSAYHS